MAGQFAGRAGPKQARAPVRLAHVQAQVPVHLCKHLRGPRCAWQPAGGPQPRPTGPNLINHAALMTGGGFQVPSNAAAFGMYSRIISHTAPSWGAGSQLGFLLGPGLFGWT